MRPLWRLRAAAPALLALLVSYGASFYAKPGQGEGRLPVPSQTEGSPDFSKQVDAGLVLRLWTSAEPVCARGATRGPLSERSSPVDAGIRGLRSVLAKGAAGNAHGCQNRSAELSHTKRSTRRARTAVVTKEPKLSAAHARRPSPAAHD